MKYTTFLLLIASSSAINMNLSGSSTMSGSTIKCIKKGNDDKCVVPGSSVECDCPPPPPTVLVDVGKKVECEPRGIQGFCYVPGSDLKCTCQTPKVEYTDKDNATSSALSQKKPECERRAGAGYCTQPGSDEKCKCPKEALTQIEYGACTKIVGEGGSSACIMRGSTWPTEKDVYCICPETNLA